MQLPTSLIYKLDFTNAHLPCFLIYEVASYHGINNILILLLQTCNRAIDNYTRLLSMVKHLIMHNFQMQIALLFYKRILFYLD